MAKQPTKPCAVCGGDHRDKVTRDGYTICLDWQVCTLTLKERATAARLKAQVALFTAVSKLEVVK